MKLFSTGNLKSTAITLIYNTKPKINAIVLFFVLLAIIKIKKIEQTINIHLIILYKLIY